jgi:hypothetical protein
MGFVSMIGVDRQTFSHRPFDKLKYPRVRIGFSV